MTKFGIKLEEVVLLIMFQTSLHRAQIKEIIWFIIHSIITNILIFFSSLFLQQQQQQQFLQLCNLQKLCVVTLNTWLKRALQVLLNAATNY